MAVRSVPRHSPDSGYAWVVLGAACLLSLLLAAGTGTLGVFLLELVETLDVRKVDVAWIVSIQIGTAGLSALVIGPVVRRCGCRAVGVAGAALTTTGHLLSAFMPSLPLLWITLGLVVGLGQGCSLVTSIVSVQRYFHRKRALAGAILTAGVSSGIFFWPPWTRWMIHLFAWRGALIMNAGVHLQGLIAAILLRDPPKTETVTLNDTETSIGDRRPNNKRRSPRPTRVSNLAKCTAQNNVNTSERWIDRRLPAYVFICSTPRVVLFILATALIHFGHVTPFTFTPLRAVSLGSGKDGAAMLVSMMGVGCILSRLTHGWLGDRRTVNRTLLYAISALTSGLFSMLSVFIPNYAILAVYCVGFSLSSGGYVSLMSTILADLVGLECLPEATGVLLLAIGCSLLVSMPLAGFLIDMLGDPSAAFLVAGAVQFGGGLIALVITWSMCPHKTWWCRKKDASDVPEAQTSPTEILS